MLNYVNTLWNINYIIAYNIYVLIYLCSIVRNVKYCEAIQAFHLLDNENL